MKNRRMVLNGSPADSISYPSHLISAHHYIGSNVNIGSNVIYRLKNGVFLDNTLANK